jgi:hypothetical protein
MMGLHKMESDRMTGEISPLWHIIDERDEHGLISTPWNSAEEKYKAIAALRKLFAAVRVQRVAFICEAWTVTGRDASVLREPPPSEHPDRREVVRIHVEERGGKPLSGHFFILRPEHGPAVLSPFHDMVHGGSLIGMLAD